MTKNPAKELVKDAIKGTKKQMKDNRAFYGGKITELSDKVNELLKKK